MLEHLLFINFIEIAKIFIIVIFYNFILEIMSIYFKTFFLIIFGSFLTCGRARFLAQNNIFREISLWDDSKLGTPITSPFSNCGKSNDPLIISNVGLSGPPTKGQVLEITLVILIIKLFFYC